MSRKPVYVVVLSLLGLLFALPLPRSCLACSCAQPPTPVGGWTRAALLTQGDVIFRGEVVHAGPLKDLGGGVTDGTYQVTFQVAEVWQGAVKESVVVQAGQGGGDCTIPFKVGQEWLIYGYGDPSDVVTTGICSRTSQLPGGRYADDLAVLASGTPVPAVDSTTSSLLVSTMTANPTEDVGVADIQPPGTDTPGSPAQVARQDHNERSIAFWSVVAGGVLALAVVLTVARRERAKRRP